VREKSGGRHGRKRVESDALEQVQEANREWWERTPMTYDWSGAAEFATGSTVWFDDQDRRSVAAHRHFLKDRPPFALMLKESSILNRRVLEIGVGSGFHAELLVRAGAKLTGIDISPSAIDLSRKRFHLKGLSADFQVWDAEQDRPEFHDQFDIVWSWGVIHHSAHTARIVRNIRRWLRAEGVFAGMVYNRDSLRLPVALVQDWVLNWNWSHSIDEALWRSTDGFSARFYPADQWRDLLLAFFTQAEVTIEGIDVDLIPLPGRLRRVIWDHINIERKRRSLHRTGSFLLFRADRPFS
jgi:SAM-dependent methyltransferase